MFEQHEGKIKNDKIKNDKIRNDKIKNDKIMCCQVELSCNSFDIIYRLGKKNISPDAFSQILVPFHRYLYHSPNCLSVSTAPIPLLPGITIMSHFVCAQNLPLSVEEIIRMLLHAKFFRGASPGTVNLMKITLFRQLYHLKK